MQVLSWPCLDPLYFALEHAGAWNIIGKKQAAQTNQNWCCRGQKVVEGKEERQSLQEEPDETEKPGEEESAEKE